MPPAPFSPRTQGGIRIVEEAQAGNVISAGLREMGKEIQAGTRQTLAAIAKAQRLIWRAIGGGRERLGRAVTP